MANNNITEERFEILEGQINELTASLEERNEEIAALKEQLSAGPAKASSVAKANTIELKVGKDTYVARYTRVRTAEGTLDLTKLKAAELKEAFDKHPHLFATKA